MISKVCCYFVSLMFARVKWYLEVSQGLFDISKPTFQTFFERFLKVFLTCSTWLLKYIIDIKLYLTFFSKDENWYIFQSQLVVSLEVSFSLAGWVIFVFLIIIFNPLYSVYKKRIHTTFIYRRCFIINRVTQQAFHKWT